jgi:bleomycin hydrolase
MKKRTFSICTLILTLSALFNTSSAQSIYSFTPLVEIEATSVKSQGRTGTCWSYSTSSFLESEAARISGNVVDISEMATVRYTYPLKADIFLTTL